MADGSSSFPAAGLRRHELAGPRVHADLDNPFPARPGGGSAIAPGDSIIVVDMHAEATSEKMAMARMLDKAG